MAEISVEDMLQAGVHFGHQTKYWNPKMKPYIFGVRNKTHIINLDSSVELFKNALSFVETVAQKNNKILFVATKRSASNIIKQEAERCGMPYVNERWLGGMLTNWDTIQNSIKKLKDLEEILLNKSNSYTKKELLMFENSVEKLNKALGGIKNMPGKPDLLFIIDTNKEILAVKEANKIGIPIVAVVDSNSNPEGIDHPIPGNDDATRSIEYYCSAVADAIKNVKAVSDVKSLS